MSQPRGDSRAEARAHEPQAGWTARELSAELPGLGLRWQEVQAVPARRSPRAVRQRLGLLSNRFGGARAVGVRSEAIAGAYRVFFRHIGLDPDVTRTPIEAAILERMLRGSFAPSNLLDDALLIALVETSVPVWALDGDAVDGPLGLRLSAAGEPLGRASQASSVGAGRIVVADAAGALAVLFGELAAGHGVTPDTRRMILFAVQVAGVPDIHVEEALWSATSVLERA